MKEYIFESSFVDVSDLVLSINCSVACANSDGYSFCVMINTWDDPYTVYYCGWYPVNQSEEDEFRDALFDYLRAKYPEHFS